MHISYVQFVCLYNTCAAVGRTSSIRAEYPEAAAVEECALLKLFGLSAVLGFGDTRPQRQRQREREGERGRETERDRQTNTRIHSLTRSLTDTHRVLKLIHQPDHYNTMPSIPRILPPP